MYHLAIGIKIGITFGARGPDHRRPATRCPHFSMFAMVLWRGFLVYCMDVQLSAYHRTIRPTLGAAFRSTLPYISLKDILRAR
jgi:hypothetical protein